MTRRLPSPCTYVDARGPCTEYATVRGRCDAHPRKAWKKRADYVNPYDAEHAKARARQLRLFPFCAWCGERASQLDHIIPLAEGGSRRDPANHQSLCESCHKAKTAEESRRARSAKP